MKQTKIIPFQSYSNYLIKDNIPQLFYAINVEHREDGYKPFAALSSSASFTSTSYDTHCFGSVMVPLPATNTTKTYCVLRDNSVYNAYELTTSAFTARGAGVFGGTGAVDFCIWGDNVIATQYHSAPQTVDATTTNNFAALGGSPPQAVTCCVVDNFVILANTYESSVEYPNRIWNSAIENSTGWTAGTDLCDYVDNPELGTIYKIVGGEYCTIFCSEGIAIMQRIGGDTGWQTELVVRKKHKIPIYSVVPVGNLIYFTDKYDFWVFDGHGVTNLGDGKVKRLAHDTTNLFGVVKGNLVYPSSDRLATASDPVFSMGHTGGYDSYLDCVLWADTFYDIVYVYNRRTNEFTTLETSSFTNEHENVILRTGNANAYQTDVANDIPGEYVGFLKHKEDAGPVYTEKYYTYDIAHGFTAAYLYTNYYELVPGGWATIIDVRPISDYVSSESIDIRAYDDSRTLIDTVSVTTVGGEKIRQTGRFFKFKVKSIVNSDYGRINGLEITYIPRGSRH